MEVLFTLIGILGIGVLAMIYGAFAYGYVAWLFYGWFLLPAIPQAPHLTLIQLIGITFTIGAIRAKVDNKYTYRDEEVKSDVNWIGFIIGPWISLALGWLFKIIFM